MTTKLINLPHLADMVFGVPHYVTRQTMDSVKAVLIPRIQGITERCRHSDGAESGNHLLLSRTSPPAGGDPRSRHSRSTPGQITAMCSELTSYERIRGQLQAALNPSISEIVLDINSGGGAAVGQGAGRLHLSVSRLEAHHGDCELQRVFRRVFHRIGLQQNHRQPDQWRGVGGVIMEHLDTSKMEEKMGLTFTTIYREITKITAPNMNH